MSFPRAVSYRTLADNIKHGINLIDVDFNIHMVNAVQRKNFNKSKRELIGKKCFREFEKRDAVCPHCPGVKAMATGKPAEVETEGVRDDGSRFHVRLQAFPIFAEDGATTGFIEIVEDISERKQMEQKLHESEEKYRSLVENIKLGISLIDADHTIIMINPAQSKRFQKPASELIGKKCYQVFEGRDTVCPHCPGIQTMATGRPAEANTEVVKNDRARFHVRLQTFPIFGEDGSASGFIEVCEDITKRVQAEEAIRASEKRFKMLAENAPFGISIMAPDRHFEYFNPLFTEIFGYTLEDIPDKATWITHAYPDEEYRNSVFSLWEKDLAEGVKIGDENQRVFTVRCKDGTDKIIDFRQVYLKDGKQYLTYEDITARIQAEETLRESEKQFQTIMDAAPIAISWADTDKKFQYFNKKFIDLFGYTIKEMPTVADWRRLAYPEEAERKKVVSLTSAFVKSHDQEKAPPSAERKVTCKDGSIRYVEIMGVNVANKLVAMLNDITERKQMEEQLRQSEERFRKLVETMRVGLSAVDANGVITYVNNQICKMLGYSMGEIVGHPTTDFQDEESRKLQKEMFAKRRKGVKDPTPYEITWVTKDGRKVNTILTPTPGFNVAGKFTGSFAIFTDITERKQMEKRLQRYATEMERSNEEVKNFAYIVSHDLRVPLVNLKGYSDELRTALGVIGANFDAVLPQLPDEKRSEVALALHEDVPEALEFITNSVSLMDSFINSVLLLARLGRRDLKLEPLDMNALVKPIVEGMSHQIQEKGITMTIDSLPEVVADRTSMEQIVGNILGNAVKYLDHERPGEIEITGEANGGETVFRIRDNGRGIAEDDMDKVFAPFRRAGKQDTPGEGMGLSYVQTLVRRHNGRIWCESEIGKGTTFIFTISNPSEQGVRHA
ncbi:MAG: PAS domain-containing sensor histidine kinase [Deltaproteobacteria bacterium]|nr:PAS domain-containing sensor histidine kinase [Deltaproteobacteria bacterium]